MDRRYVQRLRLIRRSSHLSDEAIPLMTFSTSFGSYCVRGLEVYVATVPRSQWEVSFGASIPRRYLEWTDELERKDLAMALLKRPAAVSGSQATPGPVDKGMTKVYPLIHAYLTEDSYDGGEVRERSTLLVVAEDGLFKACLIDKNIDATLWASGKVFDDMLACLETRLGDPGADWRKRKPPQNTPRKK
jgi:hypothetical protein